MRETKNLNLDWRFHLGDDPAADFMGYDSYAQFEYDMYRCGLLVFVWLIG